jgi:hypothetical protein
MKKCIDCVHLADGFCTRAENYVWSSVTGMLVPINVKFASVERVTGIPPKITCGLGATFYIRKWWHFWAPK